ncbi:MAG: J domain-containing protein [Nitrospirae bacterium]|nr:MAG: J domain-containing protein [Nitrospirota bacterium]
MGVKFKDYYDVLGVSRDATGKAIKDAFRKLARQYHPDLQTVQAKKKLSEEKFKEINEAYEVLGDPEKRKKYDRLGSRWKDGMDFTPPPGSGQGGGWTRTGSADFSGAGGFSDFFEAIFGGRGGPFAGGEASWDAGEQVRRGADRGVDLEAELELSLEELAQGGTRRVTLTARDATGRLRPKELDITLPQGLRPGERIRLKGQGATNGRAARPGDLYLKISLRPHQFYSLLEDAPDDLQMDLPLLPWEAVLGAGVMVPTLEGPVSLRIPSGSQSGQRLRLRGKGLPKRDGARGDLYVRLVLVAPKTVGPRERELYDELAKLSSEDPRSAFGKAGRAGR